MGRPDADPPEPSELGDASRAVGDLLDAVAETVERTHGGVAGRLFSVLGPLAWGVRPVHDAVAALTYRAVRGGVRGTTAAAGTLADRQPGLRRLRLLGARRGVRVVAAASGIVGDRIARDHPRLDLGMRLSTEDGAVVAAADEPPTPPATASSTVIVLIHGLCEDENSWHRPSRDHRAARRAGDEAGAHVVTHGRRLADAHGVTPLYLRYNTGRRITDNGRRLARLLEELRSAWPTGLDRIVFVGHSMGGLVVRSATRHAAVEGLSWPGLVSDVVYLGTPHLGAPLARGVESIATGLARLGETRGVADLLDQRSAGVRDLTRGEIGEIAEGLAAAREPAEHLREVAGDPPPLPHARHHLLAATITRDPEHPLGRAVGDLMVQPDSGRGRSRSRDLGFGDDVVVLGGISHFDLLSAPAVGEQLVRWLDPDA